MPLPIIGLLTGSVLVLALGLSAPAGPAASATYSPPQRWAWTDGPQLGLSSGADQWAMARVAGLKDKDHNAGFSLRRAASKTLRVAVSANRWKVEGTGLAPMGGDYAFPKTGVLRISISSADLVTVNFDGVVVATRQIPGGGFSGRGIAPTVWQTTSQVTMTDITSNVVAVPPVDPNPPPPVIVPPPLPTTPPPPPSTGTGDVSWLSGAASRDRKSVV